MCRFRRTLLRFALVVFIASLPFGISGFPTLAEGPGPLPEPIITEKSLELAKEGKYTFRVDRGLNKHQIKKLVETVFGVNVVKVRTINQKGEIKRVRGRKRVIKPIKKAIVSLAKKEKIDLFEESKK